MRRPLGVDLVLGGAREIRVPGHTVGGGGSCGQEHDRIRDGDAIRLVGQGHLVARARIEREGAERVPLGGVRLLVDRHGRGPARVMHGVGRIGRAIGVRGPLGVDLVVPAHRDVERPGGRVGRGAHRHHLHRVGHDDAVRLVGERHKSGAGIERVGAKQHPLPAALLLVGGDGCGARCVVDGIRRVGGAIGVRRPLGIHLVVPARGDVEAPGGGVGGGPVSWRAVHWPQDRRGAAAGADEFEAVSGEG